PFPTRGGHMSALTLVRRHRLALALFSLLVLLGGCGHGGTVVTGDGNKTVEQPRRHARADGRADVAVVFVEEEVAESIGVTREPEPRRAHPGAGDGAGVAQPTHAPSDVDDGLGWDLEEPNDPEPAR